MTNIGDLLCFRQCSLFRHLRLRWLALLCLAVLVSQSLTCQAQSSREIAHHPYRPRVMLGLGLQAFSVKNTSPLSADSTKHFFYTGTTVDFRLFQPLLIPKKGPTLGAFFAPAMGASLFRDWLRAWHIYRLPAGLELHFGDHGTPEWSGLLAGGGVTYNGYSFERDHLPAINPIKPQAFFFVGVHVENLSCNLYATQSQRWINRNGTSTRTGWEFNLTFEVGF